MQVADIRRRLLKRVWKEAASADQEATARITSYARALLISLAGRPADSEVDVRELTVGTRTAGWILTMHPEYVRFLCRTNQLGATKSNGEFRISLPEVVQFMEKGIRGGLGPKLTGVSLSSTGETWSYPPIIGAPQSTRPEEDKPEETT